MSESCLGLGACGAFLGIVGIFVVAITQVVFATMGLAHGVPRLQNPPDFGPDCEPDSSFEPRMLYVWLVVEGSIVWGSVVLGIIFPGPEVEDEQGNKKKTPGPFAGLCQLASLAWIIYGCVIVFNESIYNSLVSCDSEGAHFMYTMCLLLCIPFLEV